MLKFAHMYAKNQLPNPYGRQSVDLSGIHIPAAHKEWFARDILSENTLEHIGINSTIFQETLRVHGKESRRNLDLAKSI